ncbi:MAG: efflux system, outer rane lipoprotein NodT family, partial [Rhizobacter sp.]|nr:efflux system, outer rane lipoprotein NodT family [Rhizobacter sp.]
ELSGRTPVQAAIEASRLRLRPILMTSLAFIMGVLPLVLATGAGSEMRKAMGVAVFAGMIGVTAFGLFLTPVFYVLLRRMAGNKPLKVHGAALIGTLVVAGALAGCSIAPSTPASFDSPTQFKELATSASFSGSASAPVVSADGRWTKAAPAESQPRGQWWLAFADPVMNALVERAGDGNADIQQAASRLAEARALARSVDANRSVQVGLGAGVSRQAGYNTVGGTTPSTLGSVGADIAYEPDLFGRLAGASNAAGLDAEGRAALLQSTRLAVQAETAQAYLSLRAIDTERGIVADTVAAYRDTLRVTERRQAAGDVGELDVARVRTELASTESDALTLERRRATMEHALAVLTGDVASNFALAAGDWSTALPSIPAGVPSTVLTRRPDISQAQSAVLAAQARLGVAQTAWFPDISLTASGGLASPSVGDLVKWSMRSWGIGAVLSLPLFDGGRRQADVAAASARLDGALVNYRSEALVAFKEVEDQLSELRLLDRQAQVQDRAVTSALRATTLSDIRYRAGMVSQLELLDARRSELRNRREALQVRSAQYQSTVGLIRALGGGWESGVVVGSVN